jgi:chloride intracellular channel protein 2
VRCGVDARGREMVGLECDTVDDIEALVDRFDCHEMRSCKESHSEAVAEHAFQDVYMKFCQFLKTGSADETQLVKILEKVEAHLRKSGTRFLIADEMTRADCYLVPTLQHIRVAGKAYKNFEMPPELSAVWRYLQQCYATEAFLESCPADREIITHYTGKTLSALMPANKSQLLGSDRTLSVPTLTDDQQ